MNSREQILGRLRDAVKPFPTTQPPSPRLPMTPLASQDRQALTSRFIEEAEALACTVHVAAGEQAAVQALLAIISGQNQVLAWDFEHIPCAILESALHEAGIGIAADDDDSIYFSITGADAALAATGSLVVVGGTGRPRTTALLPLAHIAILTEDQILPNLEAWLEKERRHDLAAFQQSANINIISGPSRTADIGMELIIGMHGPKTLHIILIESL